MISIVTALKAEAQPIIDTFGLQRSNDPHFALYRSPHMQLIVAGLGPLAASIATTYLCTKYPHNNHTMVNIGICGSYRQDDTLGTCFQITKLIDDSSRKVYHHHSKISCAPTAALTCFHTAQNKSHPKYHLADMESIGYYLAAKKFIQTENIYILKVVSDYISSEILPKERIGSLLKTQIHVLKQIQNAHENIMDI